MIFAPSIKIESINIVNLYRYLIFSHRTSSTALHGVRSVAMSTTSPAPTEPASMPSAMTFELHAKCSVSSVHDLNIWLYPDIYRQPKLVSARYIFRMGLFLFRHSCLLQRRHQSRAWLMISLNRQGACCAWIIRIIWGWSQGSRFWIRLAAHISCKDGIGIFLLIVEGGFYHFIYYSIGT